MTLAKLDALICPNDFGRDEFADLLNFQFPNTLVAGDRSTLKFRHQES